MSGPFDVWMNDGTFGTSMFRTGQGDSIAHSKKRKEKLLRLSQFVRLVARRFRSPRRRASWQAPGGTFQLRVRQCLQRDLIFAFMSTTASLSDLLLIMMPGVPFTQAQTREVFVASTWSCLLRLALIFIAQVRVSYIHLARKTRVY